MPTPLTFPMPLRMKRPDGMDAPTMSWLCRWIYDANGITHGGNPQIEALKPAMHRTNCLISAWLARQAPDPSQNRPSKSFLPPQFLILLLI